MKDKEKRLARRLSLLVPLPIKYFVKGVQDPITAEVINISEGGVFVETPKLLPKGTDLTVIFNLPEDMGIIALEGKVLRIKWTNIKNKKSKIGFAVQFNEDNKLEHKKYLKAFIIYLHNKQIATISTKILEEFFGFSTYKKPPTSPNKNPDPPSAS